MKIKILISILILSLLTGCTSVVKAARYIYNFDKIDNYIFEIKFLYFVNRIKYKAFY